MEKEKKHQQIVVMTGATSGLGKYAVQHMAAQENMLIMIGARGNADTMPQSVKVLPVDLASLSSVRKFAGAVIREIGDSRINILVLNAGMQTRNNEQKSADGYELTFAVNHLAHYLLARLLVPYMADKGRLVITTSETHDPKVFRFAPKTLEPVRLAHPDVKGFGTGIRAYAASKLCNLLTAQSFAKMDDIKDRQIKVIAYSPGLTPGTGLGRDSSGLMRVIVTFLMHTIFRIVGLFRPEYVMGTPERSGEALAEVAMETIVPPNGRIYVILVKGKPTFPNPSELAQSQEAQELLWHESASMVDIE